MPKKLVQLKVNHIAGVDSPANKRKFLIVKRETSEEIEKLSVKKEDGKFCVYDGDKKMGEFDSMQAAQAAMMRMGKKEGGTMLTKEQLAKIADKELQEAVMTQMEELNTATAKNKELTAELEKVKAAPPPESPDEEMWKGVSPAIRMRYEAMQKENKEMSKKVEEEKDEREAQVWIGKVKAFRYIPHIVPDTFGRMMGAMAKHCPKEVGELFKILTSADEVIHKGDLFRELGRNGDNKLGDATDITARVQALSEDMMKRDNKLSLADAQAKIFKDNPEWYAAWRQSERVKI